MTTPQKFNRSIYALLEVVRTTDLSQVASLAELQADIDAVAKALTPEIVPGTRMQAGLTFTPARFFDERRAFENPNEFFPYSPVIGDLNPLSPLANFDVVDGQIRGQVTLGAAHNGPPGSVHGGMIALVMDELLGCTCLAHGTGGFTGTLSVRYQALVPLDTQLELHGWIDREEGRKIFAKGEIRLGEQVLTTAEGIFIRARDADAG